LSDLFFYDDATARTFEPFALTRPACELRAGALLIRERWEFALSMKPSGIVAAPHLKDFSEPWSPSVVDGTLAKGSWLVQSRFAAALAPIGDADVLRSANRVVGVKLDRNVDAKELAGGTMDLEKLAKSGGTQAEVRGRWIDHVWDFIAHLQTMLGDDVSALAGLSKGATAKIAAGEPRVFVEDGATVEQRVHFDTTAGPVLVRRGATLQAFTRVVGPCVIGRESVVGGDKISGSSIGDACRVHGELSASIILGHSNKSHEGFVGHSYVGRWVNLGAGTTTSNLKNTYGPISLWTPDGDVNTGLQFLGTFFGDHAKTGIGAQLTTGSVVGAGANLYGLKAGPVVPPFAWGDEAPYDTYKIEKFLEVAKRVMERRNVPLGERQEKMLAAAHKARWSLKAAAKAKGKKK
jgi:UDP-N-acetylglucosamine diphosphorylase/glucosamine-1-phosphate N-acetyltransferase